jgi:BMFP domain-containing protein YqiC
MYPTGAALMFSQKLFEEITAKVSETIAASPAKDIEKNIKALMASTFSRLDLVTREEFDVQQEMLVRSREQLAQLEHRLSLLEAAQPSADREPAPAKD